MASIDLSGRVGLEEMQVAIGRCPTKDKSIFVQFSDDCFLETSAIALLTSWLLGEQHKGRAVSLIGTSPAISYLARMDFHRALGLAEPDHGRSPEAGRFLPILLVKDGEAVFNAVNLIADMVLQQFDEASAFLPAFEWAVNEIVDNVFIHSESPTPGVVCAQYFPNLQRLDIAICDNGIGLLGSLSGSFGMETDAEAIEIALTRGKTRDKQVGQGNGMAGSLEIMTQNKGGFSVWSGKSTYEMKQGEIGRFRTGSDIAGTGVAMSFDLRNPVSLEDTWIAASGDSMFLFSEGERIAESGFVLQNECSHTGSRPPATRIRRKILALLPEAAEPIQIDFTGVRSVSSSFLDELLGRLMAELGRETFNDKIVVTGMTELQQNMANNVIRQRLDDDFEMSTDADTQGTEEIGREFSGCNSWLALDDGTGNFPFPDSVATLIGVPTLFKGITEGDWFLVTENSGRTLRVGRVLRLRSDLENTTVYFDRSVECLAGTSLARVGFSLPSSGSIGRLQWNDFVGAVPKLTGKALEDVPLIDNQAYIRELLQLAVMDDLLGPANGPHEHIVDMGVRDRYLVGKLAPQQRGEAGGIEGLEGPLEAEDEKEPDDLEVHTGRHDPGAEFDGTTGKVDAEAEAADEIDAQSNQSLIPSSFGFTFCVDGDIDKIEVDARWGQYLRIHEHEYKKTINRKVKDEEGNVVETRQEEVKTKVWQRVPCGGKITLDLTEGVVPHHAPDKDHPEIRIQGTIRGKNANGDRLVTLFLVNAQQEPEENKDSAWLFQPEIAVLAASGATDPAIFRRRLALSDNGDDPERDALEMIYRRQVEFAVGHGVAVHADTVAGDPERATSVRTVVMPQYEVPVTETPGLRPEDRPAMREMVDNGYLDMDALAAMERDDLVATLSILADDYGEWIDEQTARIGADVVGHDAPAKAALQRCQEIRTRLEEGIAVLADKSDDKALKAFRFANHAMARQRIHSLYALSRRRGEGKGLAAFELRKNRSWRPFQLAFILLSLPSLADPTHKDRSEPVDAYADLLWFPTGGGKTEAYLGVAAFAMAIRRLQGKLGGFDGGRGLGVIMRYTLRLLTLQQFQRASTLICAMELLRQESLANGDESLGQEPFTIGLWVGNKVTPGKTDDAHRAIKDIRDPDKFDAGGTSPAQLTSCPWCGCEVSDKRDIDVDTFLKRTTIYCGDKKSHCEFSRGKSSKKPHPGIPVVVVDEEIYHRPPSMMIATVDKFALMAWRGQVRTLFGRATSECPRHGLLWPESDCSGNHPASKGLPRSTAQTITPLRPPDLIIQDEFHLISGPLGTMVGLYETAIDELSGWKIGELTIKPKIVASTATVRKASEQVNNVFMRRVAVFPPHGLNVADNFFSVQRPTEQIPGRRYMGVCSPGSSRPAMLIRVYTAFLTASQALFDRFGQAADPYLTAVGYFNSLRELGGMKRLAEDDVQTRSYRVQMSLLERPGLAQRSVSNIRELTSRVSSRDIPKYLDQLEVKFKARFDPSKGKYVTEWADGEARAIDVVLATNMLSVGVDVNRLGLMAVNGQPKGTAEYIQATSRVGRSSPGLVCTVLTWARPRDLSHYETFEHYHATFYKHVEAQSVTPFSPRAMDRGLTGALLSVVRLENDVFNPNVGAGVLDKPDKAEVARASSVIVDRAWSISQEAAIKTLASDELKERLDEWANEAGKGGRTLAYEKKGPKKDTMVALLHRPGIKAWDNFTVPMSMREVEPGVRLVMSIDRHGGSSPAWAPPPIENDDSDGGDA